MRILILTNTFTPHVGGVARSVQAFTNEYRRRGHRVLVTAPEFEGMPANEEDVVRIPAIQRFNGSDFSVPLPIPGYLAESIENFQPDVVHSNHPFLLGDTALRAGAYWNLPIVFTHHTMYEQYTHYIPGDSPAMQRFAVDLATGYANLCDAVIAPSESIALVLRARGVHVPLEVIPTGVDLPRFQTGDGPGFRRRLNIPAESFVVGHLGRLAPEKNLVFLARAAAAFVARTPQAVFLLVGAGPALEDVERIFSERGMRERLFTAGVLSGTELSDAYHAMDLFAFASKSETQGMVLTEAMAAGVPVVALDAPGARDVVIDGENGRLLREQSEPSFVAALDWVRLLSPEDRRRLSARLAETAEQFSLDRSVTRALDLYQRLIGEKKARAPTADSPWSRALRMLEEEWKIWSNAAAAAGDAVLHPGKEIKGPA